jgi:Cof subfamily protein (haloacid dehalogenase superfamily)
MGYKIIASDLDGTLLNSEARVSRENLSAISEISKRGAHFVPSTGRSFSEIPEELKSCPDIRYYIYSNGTVVFDKLTGERIARCISSEDCRFILETLMSGDAHITVRQNGGCFADGALCEKETLDRYNVCDAHRVVMRDYAVCVSDFTTFCLRADNVETYSAFFPNYEKKQACKEILGKNKSLRMTEVDEYNIEVFRADAGKGSALVSLAEMLGVSISDTIAMGDSRNDTSIVETAGLGLAVSNATEYLKSIADAVICSNDEHVAEYILASYELG